MNRRYRALPVLMMLCCWTANVHAQPAGGAGGGGAAAPAATLAPSVYENPTGERPKIDAFVSSLVINLVNDKDQVAQSKARDALISALYPKGAAQPPAQPAFMFEYGRALDAALSARLAPNLKPTLRQRLNIAIVAARAAAALGNDRLAPTVILLLNDPAEPIVLWGMKAAAPLVPELMKLQGNANKPPPLVAAIGPAVLRHPTGEIFDEAYSALSLNHKLIFDELIKLWENRLIQYQNGIPEDPSVDGKAVFAVTTANMWNTVLTKQADREKVMQMVSDQLYAVAQRADEVGQGEMWEQLVRVTARSGGAVVVVAQRGTIQKLTQAADPVSKLTPDNAKGVKLKDMVAPVLTEIRNAFNGVQAPQPLKPLAALAQP
jgi:hypothetical protein